MNAFLSGMTAALFITSAIFFLKFWKASRNRFFGFFAAACSLFALERILSRIVFLAMEQELYEEVEARGWVYLLRLAAFILIFVAVLDRNKSMQDRKKPLQAPAGQGLTR